MAKKQTKKAVEKVVAKGVVYFDESSSVFRYDALGLGSKTVWGFEEAKTSKDLSNVLLGLFERKYQDEFAAEDRGKGLGPSAVGPASEVEKPKPAKPAWQLWYEMDEDDRVRSFSKEGLFDPSLHAFFFDDALDPEAGPIDASSFNLNLSLKVIVTLEDPDADDPKIAEVLYIWEYPDNHHIATAWGAERHTLGEARLNSVLCFVDDWCKAKLDRGEGVKEGD